MRQRELIEQARDLLISAGAPQPIAFRAGSYSANAHTLEALRSLGLAYDSSHNGSEHPDPSNLPLPPAVVAPVLCNGVVEIPITQIEGPDGSLRHLQLCAVSFRELRAALAHAHRHRHPLTTIVSHSFELASRRSGRPNRSLCARFEALCRHLGDHAHVHPTVHFADLADLPLDCPAEPLPANPLRSAGRMAEQLWANLVYERQPRGFAAP